MTKLRSLVPIAVGIVLVLSSCGQATQRTNVRAQGPTWRSVDLVGQSAGFRSATFDASRNCIWILTRQYPRNAGGRMFVTLTRLNVADRSVVATPVNLSADGYDIGSLAVDSRGGIWMGWGQMLSHYDPLSGTVKSWSVPAYSGLGRLYSMDDRMVSLTIDTDGRVWVAQSKVSAVFGFNPSTNSWDRTVSLQFVPVQGTELNAWAVGRLTLNGVTVDGTGTSVFATVNTTNSTVTMLPAPIRSYVVSGRDEIIYADRQGDLVALTLVDAKSTLITAHVPYGGNPPAGLSLDRKGQIWFSLYAYRSIGVGMVNRLTGQVSRFPFPYIVAPGSPMPNDCPTAAIHCIPSSAIAGTEIDAIVVDQRGNVWVVTALPGTDDPTERFPMTPVIELQTSP